VIEQTVVPGAPAPSRRAIAQATLVALAVAAIVLVTTVLPAEYGIDPLGTGRALGLTRLSAQGASAAPIVPVVAAASGPLKPQASDFKTDTAVFSLLPYVGFVEYHYRLAGGATMEYAWKADGKVAVDFHTQPDGKPPEASETFEKGEMDGGRGAYVSPYNGLHGWYWENRTDKVVRITVTSSGFYTEATEFRDDGTSVPHAVKSVTVSPE
jgi:hypothetical protein